MPICSYCDQERKMTREHIWPKWLLDKYPELNINYLEKPNVYLPRTEPKVKDVCGLCNNGPLSELDGYASSFYGSINIPQSIIRGTSIEIKYHYDQLLRWLLKVSFNSARATGVEYRPFLRYRSYILKGSKKPKPKFIKLYAELIRDSVSGVDEIDGHVIPATNPQFDILPASGLRISRVKMLFPDEYKEYMTDLSCIRLIGVGPLHFYIVLHEFKTSQTWRDLNEDKVSKSSRKFLFSPSSDTLEIVASDTHAIESSKDMIILRSEQWDDFKKQYKTGANQSLQARETSPTA